MAVDLIEMYFCLQKGCEHLFCLSPHNEQLRPCRRSNPSLYQKHLDNQATYDKETTTSVSNDFVSKARGIL